MNKTFALLVANLPALFCFGVGAWLAAHDRGGWGWFLFVGVLVSHVMDGDKDKS